MDPQLFNGEQKPFEVSLLRSEDTEGVARLFKAVHGEDYPIKIFYDPVQLAKANREGDYYSTVAKSREGEIIGIHNLFRSAPSRNVYEWGAGLVSREWRSMGVSGAIERYIMDNVVPKLGMHTVFGEPVTMHLKMQKHSQEYGFFPTGVEIGLMPGEAYSGEGVLSKRVTILICFRVYRNIPQEVFLPSTYEDALSFLYEGYSSGRVFSESTESLPVGSVSVVERRYFDFAKVTRITFHEAGADFAERIAELESEAVEKGCLVIQVWLKLTRPWIGAAVNILRERGFFLGGLLPQWFDDDGILMQKVFFMPEFELIRIYSDRSRRMLELVKADLASVTQK